MKRFTLTFTILCVFVTLAYAGTERYAGKEKEVLQPAPPACEWYRAHEWNLNLWGGYAFSADTGINSFSNTSDFETGVPEGSGTPSGATDPNQIIPIGKYRNDQFIDRDGAWAGGADVKFFFSKYWALGAEGFVVDCNDNSGGAGLATFTFRFPIGCSRFAPYAWGGFGGLSGGSHSEWFFEETHHVKTGINGPFVREFELRHARSIENKHTDPVGQFGGGIEVRITKHIGLMGDFAWQVVGRDDNKDFGLGRFGVTLSY
jgi:hypothetical protein